MEAALAGARDIIAEIINEDQDARAAMRDLYENKGVIQTKVMTGKEEAGQKFRDYFEWSEPLAKAPSHRVLAVRRGEKEEMLSLRISPPEEDALALLSGRFVTGQGPWLRAGEPGRWRQLQAPVGPQHGDRGASELQEAGRRGGHQGVRRKRAHPDDVAAPWAKRPCWPSTPASAPAARSSCLDQQGNILANDVINIRVTSSGPSPRQGYKAHCGARRRGHRHWQRHGQPGDREPF